jgi:dihydroneopterin aldolase
VNTGAIDVDKIFLRELQVQAVIGIWEWERRITQTVRLDLEMATDARAAAKTDSVDDALNYKDIAKRVIEFTRQSKFALVETLAESVARIIVQDFGVAWVRVSVAKPGAIEGSREVGVTIERRDGDYG